MKQPLGSVSQGETGMVCKLEYPYMDQNNFIMPRLVDFVRSLLDLVYWDVFLIVLCLTKVLLHVQFSR